MPSKSARLHKTTRFVRDTNAPDAPIRSSHPDLVLRCWRLLSRPLAIGRSDQIARHGAAPGLGKDPRVALVGVEHICDVERLGVGRDGAGGLDARAPLAA